MHSLTGFLSITAGILFMIGSVVYWPSLSFINPNTGGILFIIGSSMFFACDIIEHFVTPTFSPLKPFSNIGSLKNCCVMIGNIAFIIGSVFFLPAFPPIIGDNIFIIASIFIWIPQMFACCGLYIMNQFTADYYFANYHYRKYIIMNNSILATGCLLFFLGTIIFRD